MITCSDAQAFLTDLPDQSVHLLAIDPPYCDIVPEGWDRQWETPREYARWLVALLVNVALPKLTPDGSLVMFQALGKHDAHPIFQVVTGLEAPVRYTFRNWITWKKRRAYGKSHDYLYCREEILWFSKSPERTEVRFNIPLTDTLRGYKGFDPAYPAKSDYKRVSNVWDDIPELMRPERTAQKPIPLLERIVRTHSQPGDLVVDCFAGLGTTGIAALTSGRRFLGCDLDPEVVPRAKSRLEEAAAAWIASGSGVEACDSVERPLTGREVLYTHGPLEAGPSRRILRNMAQCSRCREVIESKSVHDFVMCSCKGIFTDGGREYIRRGSDGAQALDLTEYEATP